jgi:hypothetical protein
LLELINQVSSGRLAFARGLLLQATNSIYLGMNMSRRALTAFLGVLAAIMIAPAQAKTVGSTFDPTYFSGSGTFFVPDAPSDCLTLGIGLHYVNFPPASCTGVLLLSANVDVTDPNPGTNFADLSLPPPTPNQYSVAGMVLNPAADPIVVGFNTFLVPISETNCGGDLCSLNWYIQWFSGLTFPNPENPLNGLANEVILWDQTCTQTDRGEKCGLPKPFPFGGPATNVTFTPEPGSLGLLLGALGAGWLARRRKPAA